MAFCNPHITGQYDPLHKIIHKQCLFWSLLSYRRFWGGSAWSWGQFQLGVGGRLAPFHFGGRNDMPWEWRQAYYRCIFDFNRSTCTAFFPNWYYWCKKSCTSWHREDPMFHVFSFNYNTWLAGFMNHQRYQTAMTCPQSHGAPKNLSVAALRIRWEENVREPFPRNYIHKKWVTRAWSKMVMLLELSLLKIDEKTEPGLTEGMLLLLN